MISFVNMIIKNRKNPTITLFYSSSPLFPFKSTIFPLKLFQYFPIGLILHKHFINPRKSQLLIHKWINILKQHLSIYLLSTVINYLEELFSIDDAVLVTIRFLESGEEVFELLLVDTDEVLEHCVLESVLGDFLGWWELFTQFRHDQVNGLALVPAVQHYLLRLIKGHPILWWTGRRQLKLFDLGSKRVLKLLQLLMKTLLNLIPQHLPKNSHLRLLRPIPPNPTHYPHRPLNSQRL